MRHQLPSAVARAYPQVGVNSHTFLALLWIAVKTDLCHASPVRSMSPLQNRSQCAVLTRKHISRLQLPSSITRVLNLELHLSPPISSALTAAVLETSKKASSEVTRGVSWVATDSFLFVVDGWVASVPFASLERYPSQAAVN